MKSILKNFLLIFAAFIISCDPAGSSFSPNPEPIIPAEINVGTGMFIFSMNDIDGGLIGGASLDADSFSTIINSF